VNALFAGSDGGGEHWAIIASLIETCKTRWRRSADLSRRRHHQDRQRPSQQPHRRSSALGLRPVPRPQSRGLKTPLALNSFLSHPRRMRGHRDPRDNAPPMHSERAPLLPARPSIAASSAMESAACPRSPATSQQRRNSRPIQSASSTSTSPRSGRRKASSTYMSPSIGPRSLPSSGSSTRPTRSRRGSSSTLWWRPSRTRSKLF
jgi:hypothetical protein